MYRDPELPAGFQDADFEMRDLQSVASRVSKLRKRGICVHGWTQGQPNGSVKCLDCGALFATAAAHWAAHKEARGS